MQLTKLWIAAVVVASATAANAAVWSKPSGETANFTYANGRDTNGLFGDPTVAPNGFSFAPERFVAQSSNGGSAQTYDYLTVDVAAKPGTGGIRGIRFGELGDYSIFNGGGVNVQAYVAVQVLDNNFGGKTSYTGLFKQPVFGAAGQAVGDEFSGAIAIDFGGKSAQTIRIVVNNILQAFSNPNGSAIIQKKLIADPDGDGPGIEIISGSPAVPEPATLAALGGIAAIALVRRRSR